MICELCNQQSDQRSGSPKKEEKISVGILTFRWYVHVNARRSSKQHYNNLPLRKLNKAASIETDTLVTVHSK